MVQNPELDSRIKKPRQARHGGELKERQKLNIHPKAIDPDFPAQFIISEFRGVRNIVTQCNTSDFVTFSRSPGPTLQSLSTRKWPEQGRLVVAPGEAGGPEPIQKAPGLGPDLYLNIPSRWRITNWFFRGRFPFGLHPGAARSS